MYYKNIKKKLIFSDLSFYELKIITKKFEQQRLVFNNKIPGASFIKINCKMLSISITDLSLKLFEQLLKTDKLSFKIKIKLSFSSLK